MTEAEKLIAERKRVFGEVAQFLDVAVASGWSFGKVTRRLRDLCDREVALADDRAWTEPSHETD